MSVCKTRWLVFFFLFLFYSLWFSGKFYSQDEVLRGALSWSLASEASLHFQQEVYEVEFCRYPIGQSLVGVPLAWVEMALIGMGVELGELTLLPLANALVSALVGVVLFELFVWLGMVAGNAVIVSLLVGLGSLFLPYSRTFLSEPLVSLGLLGSFLFILKGEKKGRGVVLVSGIFYGLVVLTNYAGYLFLPLFIVLGLTGERRWRVKELVVFLLPVVAVSLVNGWVNYRLYGTPFQLGYGEEGWTTNFWVGAYGLLLSAGRGMIWHAPWLLVSLVLFFSFVRERKREGIFILALSFAFLLVYGRFWTWHGGWTPGCRFLIPLLGFWALPLVYLPGRGKGFRWFAGVLFGVSVLIAGLMTLVNPLDYNNELFGILGNENAFLFIPQVSHLSGLWLLVEDGRFDPLILRMKQWWLYLLWVVVLAGVVILVMKFNRALAPQRWSKNIVGDVRGVANRYPYGVGLLFIVILLFLGLRLCEGPRGLQWKRQSGGNVLSGQIEMIRVAHKPEEERVRYVWQGYVQAPISGNYVFYLKVKGKYRVELDREMLMLNMEKVPQHLPSKKLHLKKGYHRLWVEYEPDDREEGIMNMYWTLPGEGTYVRPVGKRFFSPELPGRRQQLVTELRGRLWWLGLLLVVAVFLWEGLTAETRRRREGQRDSDLV